jgi:hypothetical protein
MSRKTLTFKSPDRMKVVTLVFIVALVFSPSVRQTTASILHTTADILSPQQ